MPLEYYPNFDHFNCHPANDAELKKMARRYESNDVPGDDIRQEFSADASVRRDYELLEFRNEGQLASWVNTRLSWIATKLLRKSIGRGLPPGKAKNPTRLPSGPTNKSGPNWDPAANNTRPNVIVETHELLDRLTKAVDCLSAEQRHVVVGRIIEKKSWKKLSEELKLPVDQVKRLYDRGIQRLREEMGESD
jgi:RNA polymerase sigma factor (sigma-70 family)